MKIQPIEQWWPLTGWPSKGEGLPVIAGPCGAESLDQVLATARQIASLGRVQVFRAGVWKPRTRPGGFEGMGAHALDWLCRARQETGLKLIVEVATQHHVAACLNAGIDMVWVGARTCANPFSVQEIADAVKGLDLPVLVKNPLNPDIDLWTGAVERFLKAGIVNIAAVLRGCFPFEKICYRNSPNWEMAIELKTRFPGLPIICDPSHMAGDRRYIRELSQQALDMDMDGLMIESHVQPDAALCDAGQQLTPGELGQVLASLVPRRGASDDRRFTRVIKALRKEIDTVDQQLLRVLGKRASLVERIGQEKIMENVSILRMDRWKEILSTRRALASEFGLSESFVKKLFVLIHKESISIQTGMLKPGENVPKESKSKE